MQDEYDSAKVRDTCSSIKMKAKFLLEYGKSKEGYWTCNKFMEQIKMAVKIVEVKYPKSEGWRHMWVFDHSSCHSAMANDSLDVSKMNVKPGSKQRVMHDGIWNVKPQKMNFNIGIPKGLCVVLQERGVDTCGMSAQRMRDVLDSHADFRNEKSRIEHYLFEEKGHITYFLPKYHCELNPIERVCMGAVKEVHEGIL